MAWYLNPALTNFRSAVNACWPDRDKTSDGTIGDLAHQATSSDHNPDADGSVDAWDMDVDGVDVQACIRAALAHESIQYVIYNRRITSRSWELGIWRTYDGANPHDKHVHFNTRTAYENSTKPWNIEGDDMALTPEALEQIQVAVWSANAGSKLHPVRVIDRLNAINANVAEMAGKDFVDEPAIIAGVLTGLSPAAIAAAIPAEMARQVADELAARLQG